MNSFYILIAYLSITLLGSLAPAHGQSLPTKTEAADRLKNVMRQVNLHNPDVSPFHLKAEVHYEVNKRVTDAEYELYWAAPDRFRREYRAGNAVDTDWVVDGKRFVVRPQPEELLPLVRINDLIFAPLNFLRDAPKINKVQRKNVGGTQQTSVESDQEFYSNHVCFGTAGEIVSAISIYEYRTKTPRVDLGDFAALGQVRYPRLIMRRWSPGTLEIRIGSVEAVTTFADGLFTPAPTAVYLDSCVDPVRAGEPPTLANYGVWTDGHGIDISPVDIYPEPTVASYVLIGTDGRVVQNVPIFLDSMPRSFIEKAIFPIYSCRGRPIEYEAVFVPATNAPRPGEMLLR
jgi:hypothetical protein